MAPGEVVFLQYAHVTLHLKEDFVVSDLGSMKSAHARFLFQGTDDLLVGVCTRTHSHRRPVHYIFVD